MVAAFKDQFSSVTQLCLTVCNPMNCSMPGFPVLHYLLEFAQTHILWVGDAIKKLSPLIPNIFIKLWLLEPEDQHYSIFFIRIIFKCRQWYCQHKMLWDLIVLAAQSCLTLCDPMDPSLPVSSVQARILERVATPFSRVLPCPRDQTRVSCIAGRFFTIWATREWHKSAKQTLYELTYGI